MNSPEKSKVTLPDYPEIEHAVHAMSLKTHASELHGVLSGFICVSATNLAEQFIQELISEVDVQKYEIEIRSIVSLFQIVFQQMATLTFDFHILLPDDDTPLKERAKAMSMWCYGFSDGFLQSGIDITALKSDEARDALYHITEISQLDYDALSVGEDDEKAFMELYEYVRMAVLMIHTELNHGSKNVVDGGDNIVH